MTELFRGRLLTYLLWGIVCGALISGGYFFFGAKEKTLSSTVYGITGTTTPQFAITREQPVRLMIPKLSLDVSFEDPLELNDDKTIEVPDSFERVGWYKLGAAPGEIGTASILGHVDSYEGPAVFYSLDSLSPGDTISILRDDGMTVIFEVEKIEQYKQADFPTETVYAHTSYPSLRLITCAGTYVKSAERYTHNLVVFARLAGIEGRPGAI